MFLNSYQLSYGFALYLRTPQSSLCLPYSIFIPLFLYPLLSLLYVFFFYIHILYSFAIPTFLVLTYLYSHFLVLAILSYPAFFHFFISLIPIISLYYLLLFLHLIFLHSRQCALSSTLSPHFFLCSPKRSSYESRRDFCLVPLCANPYSALSISPQLRARRLEARLAIRLCVSIRHH